MRNLILVLSMILVPAAAHAALGDHHWSAGWGIDGKGSADGSGHVAIAGTFFSSVDFGGGTFNPVNVFGGDVFLARFDSDGNHVWSQQFTPGGFGFILKAMTTAPDGSIYLAGNFQNGDIDFGGGVISGSNETVIAGFNADGTHRFSFKAGPCTIRDMDASNGVVALAGYTTGSVDFGGGAVSSAGLNDALLAVVTTAGVHVFSSTYGDTGDQGGMSVALDGANGVVLAGTALSDIDLGGGPLAVAANAAFLAGFNASGVHQWSQIHEGDYSPGSGILADMDLAISSAGNVAWAGQFLGGVDLGGGALSAVGQADVFLATFDSNGAHQSSTSYGGNKTDTAQGVAFDTQDHLALSGNFLSDAADFGAASIPHSGGFGPDWLLVLFDELGAHEYQASFTGNGQYTMLVDFDQNGDLVLTGNGAGGTDFGGGVLASTGIFIAELEGPNSGGTSTGSPSTARRIQLAQNAPNPFNPSTTISFRLDTSAHVLLEVFDAAGRRVRTLRATTLDAGRHQVVFDGRSDDGHSLASGVYHYRLSSGGQFRTKSMVLVK